MRKALVSLILLLGALAGAPAWAATYYVSTSGSDSNSGSQASPFRTITYAYSRVVAGDTILVQPGRYTDYTPGSGLYLNKSGTASAPITLKSIQRGGAIIDAQQNPNNACVVAIGGSYNILDGFRLTNHVEMGIGIWGGRNNVIRHNEIDHVGMGPQPTRHSGVYTDNASSYNVYDGNYVHTNGNFATNLKGHGFYITGHNETYINNIVVNNAGYGFQVYAYDALTNVHIDNNVVALNGGSGMVFYTESSSESINNVYVRNNIFYKNFQGSYGADAAVFILNGSGAAMGGGVVFDTNISIGNSRDIMTGGGSAFSYTSNNWIHADPRFVSSTDFHVLSTSPAIGAGLTLSSVTTDFAGAARQAPFTIGAYQVGPPMAPAPTPTSKPTPAPTPVPTPAPTPISSSLVKNSSFESGLTSWVNWGNASSTSASRQSGSYSVRVGTGEGGVAQTISGVVPGATYVLKVYARVGSSSQSSYVGVQARDSLGQLLTYRNAKVTSKDWARYQVTVTVPSNATSLVVYLWNNAGPSYVYADNVSLVRK